MGPVGWYFALARAKSRLVTYQYQLFHMLQHRREEISLKTNVAICNDGHQIRQLAEQATTANNFVTDLTKEMHTDSKFIKIITFLTLLYAPASLAAVS